jgi:N-acetylmuramoyl-L-alanine amidase
MNYDQNDAVTLARTLFGEARGEPLDGKVAVAWVIRNRAERKAFSGSLLGHPGAVSHVCLAPWQFSCWNNDDPNRPLLIKLQPNQCPNESAIAAEVLEGATPDPTNGADHYHTIDQPSWAHAWPPDWAPHMREAARFGGHVFYDSRRPQ